MKNWTVDFIIEPHGREVSTEVDAPTSRIAMMLALDALDLQPDELLHTLYAHIGMPSTEGPTP